MPERRWPVDGNKAHDEDDAELHGALPHTLRQDERLDEADGEVPAVFRQPCYEIIAPGAPEHGSPERRTERDEPFEAYPRVAEESESREQRIKKSRERTAAETGNDDYRIDEMQAVGYLFPDNRICCGDFEKAQSLHGQRAAGPGRGGQQMNGLEGLDQAVVRRTQAKPPAAVFFKDIGKSEAVFREKEAGQSQADAKGGQERDMLAEEDDRGRYGDDG